MTLTPLQKAHFKLLKNTLNSVVLDGESITLEQLRQQAEALAPVLASSLERQHVDEVIVRVTEMRDVELRLGGGVIDAATFVPWLMTRKSETPSIRWDAYRQLLINRSWAPNVIKALDSQTDTIVELMGNPNQEGEWARRGLVIGEVQSGKTATYIGVLNKAMDYGYKVVIIIGGHTEDLRRQTQRRVDTDLIGSDSEDELDNVILNKTTAVGVGLLQDEAHSQALTTVRSDFSSSAKRATHIKFEGDVPFVFVVKKHAGVLQNLATYLRSRATKNRLSVPLIVIDDEADWASINTKSEEDIAVVNLRIRELLESSSRSSYLGITATPFANILIDDEIDADLFPRDYIHALESPSDYVGVERYFGIDQNDSSKSVRTDIADCLAVLPFAHKKSTHIAELPSSMQVAIAVFLVGTAIRRLREGAAGPSSMMINVSRFKDVQAKISAHVVEFLAQMTAAVAAEFSRQEDYVHSSATAQLYKAYNEEYNGEASWLQVRQALNEVALSVRCELVNGNTMLQRNKRLAEMTREERIEQSLVPIVFVGGDVLARGLTLDGLLISYFVRRAGAADTLLQMGRWFGYRPNYDDLVRIWIDADVVDLFMYVADVSRDLRGSLREMRAEKMTPKQFGLKMQRHPESFLITSANKQKNATEVFGAPSEVSVLGSRFESYSLSARPQDLQRNRAALDKLIAATADETVVTAAASIEARLGNLIFHDVPSVVVHQFFQSFRGSDLEPFFGSPRGAGPAQLAEALTGIPEGDLWTVAVVSGNGDPVPLGGDRVVQSSIRNSLQKFDDKNVYQFGNRRVASASDLMSTLTPEDQARGIKWRAEYEGKDIADVSIRSLSEQELVAHSIRRPRLLLYLVTTEARRSADDRRIAPPIKSENPVVAAYVAVPGQPILIEAGYLKGRVARFVANKVYARSFGIGIDSEYVEEGDA
jgi:hypothetical protein